MEENNINKEDNQISNNNYPVQQPQIVNNIQQGQQISQQPVSQQPQIVNNIQQSQQISQQPVSQQPQVSQQIPAEQEVQVNQEKKQEKENLQEKIKGLVKESNEQLNPEEENIPEEEKKKDNKAFIIFIIIIVLVGIGAIAIYYYQENKMANEKNETNDITSNNSSVKESDLDITKCLNSKGYTYSQPTLLTNKNDNIGLNIDINEDNKSGLLTIDWNKLGLIITKSNNSKEKYEINGFSKKIVNTYIGRIGTEATGTKIFFVMEDKTVEYINIFENKNNNYELALTEEKDSTSKETKICFKTKGPIQTVEGVTKIYSALSNQIENGEYYTSLAKLPDGTFYDLGLLIR